MSVVACKDDSHREQLQSHAAPVVTDVKSNPSPSSSPSPPSYDAICAFMASYAARLPEVSPYDGRSPYECSGCDYALVLHASFPHKCINLAELNWSSHPLIAQLEGNLTIFCRAALSLGLPDTPLSALQCEHLQPSASCVYFHIKVQHWLYSVAQRFPPESGYDAVRTRQAVRAQQLGEPFLKRQRDEGDVNDPQACCGALMHTKSIDAKVAARCAPYVEPLPLFSQGPAHNPKANTQSDNSNTNSDKDEKSASSAAGRPKPWLSYSKPWRLPAEAAAKAKKREAAAAAAKRAEEMQRLNPCVDAFKSQASNLHEQFVASVTTASKLRQSLRDIRADVMQKLFAGQPLDFTALAQDLKTKGVVPDTV